MKYQPDLLLENEEDPNAINRNYWYRGELMQLVPDVFKELKIELLEILSGCETANRYNVYLLDKSKTKKFYSNAKRSPLDAVETASLPITVLLFADDPHKKLK